MVEPLRHRQTKGAANRYAPPKAAAPHSYSTEPRHSIARDQRPLRVRPKSARDYPQSAATMMAALEQACLLAA